MKTLDRYILSKFLYFLLLTIIAWIVLFIIIDFSENLNKFLSYRASAGQVIFYYLLYIPYIIVLIMPISVLIASSFSLSMMAQGNEIIAMQTGGISLYRIMMPLFVAGLFLTVLNGLAAETVVPGFNRTRYDFMSYEIKKEPKPVMESESNLVIKDGPDAITYIGTYYYQEKKAVRVSYLKMNRNNEIRYRLDARSMTWDSLRQGWLLVDVVERIFEPSEKIHKKDSLFLKPRYLKPENLKKEEFKPEEMTFAELYSFIQRLKNLGMDPVKHIVDLHMKIAYPFTNFIVLLIGGPFSSRKRRSGPAIGIILGFVVSFLYFVIIRVGQVMGHRGVLDPMLSAWMGNILFFIIGVVIMIKVRK